MVDVIEKTTGATGYCLAKPNSHLLRMTLKSLSRDKEDFDVKDVLFVGDSLGTDIRLSIENGIDCALVMSGTTTQDMLERSALQPNFVFKSIKELLEAYRNHSMGDNKTKHSNSRKKAEK